MLLLVSAFITDVNNNKSILSYINYGKQLFTTNKSIYKVLFIERKVFNEYFNIDGVLYSFNYENKQYDFIIDNYTIFVFFEKHDNYLYSYIDSITNFDISTDNPNKDTLEYMLTMCHKTEWVNMAINLAEHIKNKCLLIDFTNFIWVDFGIYHVFNNNLDLFNTCFEHLYDLQSNSINKVRIGSCIHPTKICHIDIFRCISWYFAGGVFGGTACSLIKFANLMKTECVNIIHERKHIMWEVNVWYLIYLKEQEIFDFYNCNHNASIISNY
jgi:hypothetical protein